MNVLANLMALLSPAKGGKTAPIGAAMPGKAGAAALSPTDFAALFGQTNVEGAAAFPSPEAATVPAPAPLANSVPRTVDVAEGAPLAFPATPVAETLMPDQPVPVPAVAGAQVMPRPAAIRPGHALPAITEEEGAASGDKIAADSGETGIGAKDIAARAAEPVAVAISVGADTVPVAVPVPAPEAVIATAEAPPTSSGARIVAPMAFRRAQAAASETATDEGVVAEAVVGLPQQMPSSPRKIDNIQKFINDPSQDSEVTKPAAAPRANPAPRPLGEATDLLRLAAVTVPPGAAPVVNRQLKAETGARISPALRTTAAATDGPAPERTLDKVADRESAPLPPQTALAATHETGGAAQAPATDRAAAPQASPAPVDLSAGLGQKVIDMGVGGQWIDGLAREIATLAAGDGQGSFRLSPDHLGPMRVDIRQGDLGAEVKLTVQTEAAEAALNQDSGKLKADANLSALRISEVKVERLVHVAEPGRGDASFGQNASGGQHPWSQGAQGQWSQGGPQSALSQGQGNQGGNPQSGHKAPLDHAVINQGEPQDRGIDDAQAGSRRARYA